ncbi:MAG: hypothetical protein R3F20_02220 [Planctomycetota bacterium]
MTESNWFARAVAAGSGGRTRRVHLVLPDGSVRTEDVLGVVAESADHAVAIHPIEVSSGSGEAGVMVVALSRANPSGAQLVLLPGAANVALVRAE